MAPSRMERLRLGRMRSSSTRIKVPRPVHFSQAPSGLLKENSRGDKSLMEMPCSGQAKFWLKVIHSQMCIRDRFSSVDHGQRKQLI